MKNVSKFFLILSSLICVLMSTISVPCFALSDAIDPSDLYLNPFGDFQCWYMFYSESDSIEHDVYYFGSNTISKVLRSNIEISSSTSPYGETPVFREIIDYSDDYRLFIDFAPTQRVNTDKMAVFPTFLWFNNNFVINNQFNTLYDNFYYYTDSCPLNLIIYYEYFDFEENRWIITHDNFSPEYLERYFCFGDYINFPDTAFNRDGYGFISSMYIAFTYTDNFVWADDANITFDTSYFQYAISDLADDVVYYFRDYFHVQGNLETGLITFYERERDFVTWLVSSQKLIDIYSPFSVVESFLQMEIFPSFRVYYLLLMGFGGILLGYFIKVFLGG